MDNSVIFWFRRDLRLEDNHGLFKALTSGKKVVPIFIFDTNILENLPKNDVRITFIYQQLTQIHTKLTAIGSGLTIFYGTPKDVFKQLVAEKNIKAVFVNSDYEPYSIDRDTKIYTFLQSKNITFKGFKDHVIFEKNEIIKNDKTPYKVYTPYSKKWIETFKNQKNISFPSETLLNNFIKKSSTTTLLSLKSIGFEINSMQMPIYNISKNLITDYAKNRDFPAIDGTSKLGIHLRFGTISIRAIVSEAINNKDITFLKELIWREFFMQLLWHYPHTVTSAFKPKYDRIIWRNNEDEYKKWCKGETGYPLVDAGMRELNQTGFMHNRVRMITASFLCKHLLIDWRWGEAYFAEKLLDFELSSNIGNWQWVAGCGADAAPYFRIFNPTTQIQKFDKQHKYIKKWIPNFENYQPIVAHKFARKRCLDTYKKYL